VDTLRAGPAGPAAQLGVWLTRSRDHGQITDHSWRFLLRKVIAAPNIKPTRSKVACPGLGVSPPRIDVGSYGS
jgi:hypothetical protein